MKHIEVIARGVCVKGRMLLLCQSRGAWNRYLPGGHVEFGEPARAALRRELEEELGLDVSVDGFLGAVEHAFIQDGRAHSEVNLVFACRIPGLKTAAPPASMEEGLEFLWVPQAELAGAKLEPSSLVKDLPAWMGARTAPERWASTIPVSC